MGKVIVFKKKMKEVIIGATKTVKDKTGSNLPKQNTKKDVNYNNFFDLPLYEGEMEILEVVCRECVPKKEQYSTEWITLSAFSEALEDMISGGTQFVDTPYILVVSHLLEIDDLTRVINYWLETQPITAKQKMHLNNILNRLIEIRTTHKEQLDVLDTLTSFERTTVLADDWIAYEEEFGGRK
jgi:hypothetical protein